MKLTKQATDESILAEIGSRTAKLRLQRNLTQAELATQAGVAKSTVERLEAGSVATQLSSLLRVCRVLGLIDRFDLLVPDPLPSPIEQLKLAGRRRQRATSSRKKSGPKKKWHWGDE